ncbi:MAG: glycosyltransferase family 2 protein [Chlamydiales bacterium]|nr:glycosyltransferase family 2 protein [Chlamydiales bacterium]
MTHFIIYLQDIVLFYFWGLNALYLLLLLCGIVFIFFRSRKIELGRMDVFLQSEGLPNLTILVPAYNEAQGLTFSINSILNLQYSNKTIIVVNDGSTDETLSLLKTQFQLKTVHNIYIPEIKTERVVGYYQSISHPNLIVIDKENGGKSDAINAGINACTTELLLVIDADTLVDNFELSRMLRFMAVQPDKQAFGASVRVANGCTIRPEGIRKVDFPKSFLGRVQAVEYLRAFYLGRMGWEPLKGSLIISGAFSLFKTEALKKINGYRTKIEGEDMEIVVRLKRELIREKKEASTGFIAEPVCWTEVPENLTILGRQRSRWHKGVIQALWFNKSICFNPKYGLAGLLSYPYFLFGEMLSPAIEVIGYVIILLSWFLKISTLPFILTFIVLTLGLTYLLNVSCCLMEVIFFRKYHTFSHILKMISYSFFETFGYRQLSVYWRLRGFLYLFRKSGKWKTMKKEGFKS